MDSIGEFFRQVRETKGLTIDEVASKTRIRSDFVKALEEGNFAKLPDQVFARGFVRSYARSLGLDEEDAIHRFVQSAGAFYEKQDERERLRIRQAEEKRKKQANRKAVMIAIGIAILTLIILLSREQSSMLVRRTAIEVPPAASKQDVKSSVDSHEVPARPEEQKKISPMSSKSENSQAVTRRTEPSSSHGTPVTSPDISSVPVQETALPIPPVLGSDGSTGGSALERTMDIGEPLELDLEATELSWIVLQIDGGSPQEALLRPGEKAKFKAQDQFIITLGNAGGVKAELNGQPQKPFGPSGQVVRDVLLKR